MTSRGADPGGHRGPSQRGWRGKQDSGQLAQGDSGCHTAAAGDAGTGDKVHALRAPSGPGSRRGVIGRMATDLSAGSRHGAAKVWRCEGRSRNADDAGGRWGRLGPGVEVSPIASSFAASERESHGESLGGASPRNAALHGHQGELQRVA